MWKYVNYFSGRVSIQEMEGQISVFYISKVESLLVVLTSLYKVACSLCSIENSILNFFLIVRKLIHLGVIKDKGVS